MDRRVEKGVNYTVFAREEESDSWGWQEMCQAVVRKCLPVKSSSSAGCPHQGSLQSCQDRSQTQAMATCPTRVEGGIL